MAKSAIEQWARQMARNHLPRSVTNILTPWIIRLFVAKHGCILRFKADRIEVQKGNKAIYVPKKHHIYLQDLMSCFDVFFDGVVPESKDELQVVDYSVQKPHKVKGFDLHELVLPSFVESLDMMEMYLDAGQLKKGDVALDLGAFSGLSSLLFSQKVGKSGRVIAIEADLHNQLATETNLNEYESKTGTKIELFKGAVWKEDGSLTFASEGTMGSSAAEILGKKRGEHHTVPALTLLSIAEKFKLNKVDFIKCDIEGAEALIFDQPNFFAKYQPRIILETHVIDGVSTEKQCIETLSKYGYTHQKFSLFGSYELLLFLPKG